MSFSRYFYTNYSMTAQETVGLPLVQFFCVKFIDCLRAPSAIQVVRGV